MNIINRTKSTIERYHFKSKQDWMYVFVEDLLGELVIFTGKGAWGYIWSPQSRGENVTLKQFIVSAEEDYLSQKLLGGRNKCREWDPKATELEFRKQIKKARREKSLTQYKARDLWESVELCDWELGIDIWAANLPHDLNYYFEDLEEYICYRPTQICLQLKNEFIPAIKAQFQKELDS